jgi:RND family efflux transporter MFP subunit
MKKLLILTLTLAVLPLLAACSEVQGSTAPPPRPVRVAEVHPQETQGRVRYSVSVQPYEQVAVAFKSGGYVDQVLQRRDADGRLRALQPGDQLAAGTVLARVREADYRERLHQAEGSLRELEAALVKAGLDWDRAQVLFASQSLTRPELDAAKANLDASAARIDSGRAQVEMARLALADCAVTAPIAGVVLERRIENGTLVGSGSVAFVLGRVADVKASFGVPDSLIGQMTPGQAITITTEAFQGSNFPGRISGIAPSADPQSRVFNIEVTIPNRDGRLKPGMIGTIEIPAEGAAANRESGAAVPLAAVVRSNKSPNGYSVFVVDSAEGRHLARARSVELGPASGNDIAVTRGVQFGEHVVVMGATLLTDGEAVRVIP